MKEEILDPNVLQMFIDHLCSVLECEECEDPDKLKKLDSIRQARHRALCKKFGQDYTWDKDKVTLRDFSQKKLDEFFNGDVTAAAKYVYARLLDEESPWEGMKTCYKSFFSIRKSYERLNERVMSELADLKTEYDVRFEFWKKNFSLDAKPRDNALYKEAEAKFGDDWFSDHDYNGYSHDLKEKLKAFDKFTADLQMRDLTEANVNAYVLTRKDADAYLAMIALDNWRNAKTFAEVKKLVEDWNTKKTREKKRKASK